MKKVLYSAAKELKINQEVKKTNGAELWEKITDIRNYHSLGRTLFAREIGTTENTIKAMEKRGSTPRGELIQNICTRWPEYTLWLLINETSPEIGQIEPLYKLNLHENNIEVFDKNDPEHIKIAINAGKEINNLLN